MYPSSFCSCSLPVKKSRFRDLPVPSLGLKKDSSPQRLKYPSFALKTSCQKLKESLILRERRAKFHKLFSQRWVDYWFEMFLHSYWMCLMSKKVQPENLRVLLWSRMPRTRRYDTLKYFSKIFSFLFFRHFTEAGHPPPTGVRGQERREMRCRHSVLRWARGACSQSEWPLLISCCLSDPGALTPPASSPGLWVWLRICFAFF